MPRGRSASAHRKVLDAALGLLAERGIDGTSMDAIAERSGVSKATIYKHWADKEALFLDVMADVHGLNTRPKFDSGDLLADIVAVLSYRLSESGELRERITPHFVAYGARNPVFGQAWRKMAMEPPRQELRRLIKQGIERGELSPQLDYEACLALLLGPMLYWHIFLRSPGGDPNHLAQQVAGAFWRAYGTVTSRKQPEPAPLSNPRSRHRRDSE